MKTEKADQNRSTPPLGKTKANKGFADALAIESAAKRRLADEYDAAQDRGEVRGANERTTSNAEAVGVAEIGLTHKDIHEARQIRDAEDADPGVVRRTLDRLLDAGEEPTRAAIKRERAAAGATTARAIERGMH